MTISDSKKDLSPANIRHSPYAHQWMYAMERAPETIDEVYAENPENEVHLYAIYQFDEACDWELGLSELFDIGEPDPELANALTAALIVFLEESSNRHATVCGLMLCAFRAFLKNHSGLACCERNTPTIH